MNLRFLGRSLGLMLAIAALMFSGCALNDGYTPVSSSPSFGSGAPIGGGGGGSGSRS